MFPGPNRVHRNSLTTLANLYTAIKESLMDFKALGHEPDQSLGLQGLAVLQTTIGHWTLSNQILKMSSQFQIMIRHDVRT